jgi:hypothetical protein
VSVIGKRFERTWNFRINYSYFEICMGHNILNLNSHYLANYMGNFLILKYILVLNVFANDV